VDVVSFKQSGTKKATPGRGSLKKREEVSSGGGAGSTSEALKLDLDTLDLILTVLQKLRDVIPAGSPEYHTHQGERA
jgi:hypothetical protein